MKNLNSYLMMGVVVATTFFSCNQSDEITPDTPSKQIIQEDELIERNILNLSSVDASKLAKRFAKNEYEGESRSTSTINIKDIQTITSETGEALMYVVNYEDNKGFTVISATKNYTPVLAYSDEGYLNVNDASFTDNIFMNEFKMHIASIVNTECDSLRQRYAIDWSLYEKAPTMMESRTFSDTEIQQKLEEARTYYRNLGYEVHSLGAAPYLIPAANGQTAEQRATGFVNDICMHTSPQYDCMDVNLLLVNRINEQFGPYIYTAWHPFQPYCTDALYGSAGCATIAVMQLMYYYKWPLQHDEITEINWHNISYDWSESYISPDERTFATRVRNSLTPTYYPNETRFPEDCIETSLENNYSYEVYDINYSHNLAEAFMRNGKPLIIYGTDSSNSTCHYWICDGYKTNRIQFAAYMIDRDFDDYKFFSGMTDIMNEYFHLNMGTGANAWFYQDEAIYNEKSYAFNRKIFVITPDRT